MRLTIDKEQFLKALNNAGHAIAPKNPYAMLANFKISLSEKGLEVMGSNSEITIRSIVPYMVREREVIRQGIPGSVLINARVLSEVVRKMEGEELSLDVIDNSIAKVDDGRSSFRLNCANAEEYPDIDLEPDGVTFDMPSPTFIDLVEQSAFAASNKEQRPILTALNLEAAEGILVATATDSARLARKTVTIESEAKFRVNVPARVIADISKLLDGSDSVEITVSDKKSVLFRFGSTVVSTRVIPGDYPQTKSIIPQSFNYVLDVNARELLNAMDRVSILSTDKESVVRLSMTEDHVELTVRSDANGSAVEALQTFQFTGERLDVSFNSTFVVDAVKALKSEDVSVCFLAEMKPFVVKNKKDDSIVELITPVRTY